MRVLITGVDGYLGWPLALYLAQRGHEVAGIDSFLRRGLVAEMGSQSAIPISWIGDRQLAYRESTGNPLLFFKGDLGDYGFVLNAYRSFRPEAIVYLGEQPSAPYSMMDVERAVFTQTNNVMGTLVTLHAMREAVPDCHLVKLGTMGEYGTPNVDIPEGHFDLEYHGRKDRLLFPRQAGSWYHQSKVHDSHNVEMACRIWGLRSTDVMQGVVYGTRTDEMGEDPRLKTRFDFDQCFGTVINRFCAQAVIGLPITPYGGGGQTRSFIALRDSLQCLGLAVENPAGPGEYRVFNQFDTVHSVMELAERVKWAMVGVGVDAPIETIENPRQEAEEHYYNPEHVRLYSLGYQPTSAIGTTMREILADLAPHRDRIEAHKGALAPDIYWDRGRC